MRDKQMDAMIRARFGKPPAITAPDPAEQHTSFDGGARAPAPSEPPSVGSMMRAEAEERRSRIVERAGQLDSERS